MKTLVIIPYLGKLPNYFPLWLKTVELNKDYNWLLFIDDKTSYHFPLNVKVEYTTFEDIRERIKNKFDFTISLSSPYKLCDFRPAYGYIFEDYLTEYDFWAFGDIDLLYGNLSQFLTPEILANHDRILPNGHLSLFRNNQQMNNAYKMQVEGFPFYKEVFSSPRSFCFDEWPGVTSIFKKAGIKQYLKNIMADIWCRSYKLKLTKYDLKNYKRQIFVWDKGKVLQMYTENGEIKHKEFIYIHLQKRKMKFECKAEDLKNISSALVLPHRFICFQRNVEDKDLFAYSREYSFLACVSFNHKLMIRKFKRIKDKVQNTYENIICK